MKNKKEQRKYKKEKRSALYSVLFEMMQTIIQKSKNLKLEN